MQVTTASKRAVTEESVKKVIEEYESIKEYKFHLKYNFAHARKYFLIYRGKKYPSKAIFARAYGIQFRCLIKYEDNLYGGKDDAAGLLRRLGFCVTGPK